ncbi:Hcp family type VI secretion system effector [Kangiella spongicola]|uniref:Type VI secretion system tube protein Hcp n=1 Tax=Kangiella spongicola TaxID=796379 RepID=A0A318D6X9_9GAMM|nr:type VI secretion system tube protein Hcp [Kangiella spongicola]PXF64601.1 type VI secretion system tube protein Hcp [Kangiella spongicola]
MIIRVLLVAFCLSMSGAAWSAAYLKIGDIEGESRAEGHEGEIDVLSWSWGADTNRRRGCVRDFNFVKSIDKSSAPILMGQIIQEVYPEALLTVEHTGSSQRDRFEFLTLRFRNVRVESFNTGGSDGSNFSEQVSFNFEEVEYSYTPRRQDGSEGSPVTATISARQCRNN